MSKVVIVGGCAGAKVAWDIFYRTGISVVGVWRNFTREWGRMKVNHLSEEAGAALLAGETRVGWFVATGWNREREKIMRELMDALGGRIPMSAIHPTVVIGMGSHVGSGVMMCPGVIVGVGAQIWDGVILNTAATVDHDCLVRSFAQVGPGAHVCGYCEIGERAFIGAGATVIPHVRIGADAVVAAGAVVTEDVPAETTVYGVPARAKAVA